MNNSKQIDTLILTLFTEGSVFSRDLFIKAGKFIRPSAFKKTEDSEVRDLVLVSIQNRINRCLRSFGLCLKSRNYYSEFYVTGGELSTKEVARYERTAKTLQKYAATLDAGVATRQQALDLKTK